MYFAADLGSTLGGAYCSYGQIDGGGRYRRLQAATIVVGSLRCFWKWSTSLAYLQLIQPPSSLRLVPKSLSLVMALAMHAMQLLKAQCVLVASVEDFYHRRLA